MRWISRGFVLLLVVFLGEFLHLLLRLLRLSWRVRRVGPLPTGPCLYAFWHGDQVALTAAWTERAPAVLVSRSRDGSIASRAARGLGYRVTRGSSSKGAVAGALSLVRAVRRGTSAALAVDGPRGPRHRGGSSPSRLGRLAGVPVVFVAAAARRGVRLSSWDRLLIPLPFTTVFIVQGTPLVAESVQQGLDRVWHHAQALARHDGIHAVE